MADLKFGDRTYRKMGDTWMMQPATLMRGFIAVSEESTIAMLDEIKRLRTAGDALAAIVGDVVVPYDDESKARTMVTAYDTWREARREQ